MPGTPRSWFPGSRGAPAAAPPREIPARWRPSPRRVVQSARTRTGPAIQGRWGGAAGWVSRAGMVCRVNQAGGLGGQGSGVSDGTGEDGRGGKGVRSKGGGYAQVRELARSRRGMRAPGACTHIQPRNVGHTHELHNVPGVHGHVVVGQPHPLALKPRHKSQVPATPTRAAGRARCWGRGAGGKHTCATAPGQVGKCGHEVRVCVWGGGDEGVEAPNMRRVVDGTGTHRDRRFHLGPVSLNTASARVFSSARTPNEDP